VKLCPSVKRIEGYDELDKVKGGHPLVIAVVTEEFVKVIVVEEGLFI
jgi:hypothetical protein